MPLIKFKDEGKWAENDTQLPQIEVAAGVVKEVSSDLAKIIVGAGRGEVVNPKPAAKDKAKAEKKSPATKDKKKAEST